MSNSKIFNQSVSEIMKHCKQLQQSKNHLKSAESQAHDNNQNKYQFKPLHYSTTHQFVNLFQLSQNNKIIQKLKKKNIKREVKEVFIRKTDLGQNQQIFTKQELQKLKEIDEQSLYGSKTHHASLYPLLQEANTRKSDGQTKKYFQSFSLQNFQQQISSYLQWVDLGELRQKKSEKKSKILHFQKRQKMNTLSLFNLNKVPKLPLCKSSKLPNLIKLNCQYLNLKNSVSNSTHQNDQQGDNRKKQLEKFHEIRLRANQKINLEFDSAEKLRAYIYMTNQRKQALYQCEILRKIKRELGPKFYNNLQLVYGIKQKNSKTEGYADSDKQNDQKVHLRNMDSLNHKKSLNWNGFLSTKEKGFMSVKDKIGFETEAERIIQKNRNRLKQERKRVIQRISC